MHRNGNIFSQVLINVCNYVTLIDSLMAVNRNWLNLKFKNSALKGGCKNHTHYIVRIVISLGFSC